MTECLFGISNYTRLPTLVSPESHFVHSISGENLRVRNCFPSKIIYSFRIDRGRRTLPANALQIEKG